MKKWFRKFTRPKALLGFVQRLLVGTLVVSLVFIVTQDIQIFPGVLAGMHQQKGTPSERLPRGISEFFVKTLDDKRIQVWYLPFAKDDVQPKGVIVLFHGNGNDVTNMVGIQRWLGGVGFDVYSFDYRGYGRSSGWPSEEGIQFDAEAVLHFIESRHNLETTPLVYFGVSIGTGPAAYLATKRKPKVLALVTPFLSMEELAADRPLLGSLAPFLWYSFPVSNYVQSLSDTCIILAHGHADTIISSRHTKQLSKMLARENVYTLYSNPARHNNILAYLGKPICEQLVKCVEE